MIVLHGNYAETEPDHHPQNQDEDAVLRITFAHALRLYPRCRGSGKTDSRRPEK